jgi:type VI secretion system protein ImpH
MGSETRTSNPGLMQALLEKPYGFSFFQLVQLLQRFAGGARIGAEGPASEEKLRLRPAVSLTFPAADIQAVDIQEATASAKPRFRITTSFMGLYSSDSPLPTFYAEDIFWKEDNQEAVRDFVDIFQHRALSLFYRSWEKYRYPIQFRSGGKDEFSRRIFCLTGLGTDSLIESTGLPSIRLLRYAGLITQKPHSAAALTGILKDYFSLPRVRIDQCVDRWTSIDPLQQNRLGIRNCSLGRDFSLGEKVRDCSSKFRAVIGPVGLADFMRLMPVSRDYAAMVNLIRYFSTDRLDFDIQIKLRAEETPPLCLSSKNPQRLGWTSCLPHPKQDPAVVHRQPKTQSPQTAFPWPGPSSPRPESQENRGYNDRR